MVKQKYIRENIVILKDNFPIKFGNFIMALKNLEDSDDWSRICGIHGNTFKPNDPNVLCPTDPDIVSKITKRDEPVYCAHSVEPFIAWHVPYLYEFEQLLNKYNESFNKEYITLPYFDITEQNVDYSFLNSPKITILYNNEYITIDNPLSSAYYYPSGVKTKIERNGIVQAITSIDKKRLNTIRRELFNTLHAKTFEEFSSQVVFLEKRYKPYSYVPLETPHNSIHDIIGGDGGNMSDISISAFDPIFWLHHSNMDRFFYNWLKNIGNIENIFSINSLESTLAPFSKNFQYGWQNNIDNFFILKDVLDLDQYPYSYNSIILDKIEKKSAYINLIDIPIPQESITINAYLYPIIEELNEENKDNWYAGSVSWLGINRKNRHCNRCEKVRTNLKIDILDYVNLYNINNNNLNKYELFMELNGKIIKNLDGTYIKYSINDIVKDGEIIINIENF
jgi:hypothetical protein